MSDIFICYSRTDSTLAAQLEKRLTEKGWSVFRDVQTHVGRRWHKEIEKELHEAKAVVVLWSAKSRDSDYVLAEADYGKSKNILFPAFIERVEFPLGFGRIETADLIAWAGEVDHPGLIKLMKSLELHLAGGETQYESIQPAQALAPGQTFRDKLKLGGEGPLMGVIPPGRFLMGSPQDEPERSDCEGPKHKVTIAAPFLMGVYSVTFDDYDLFCESTKRGKPKGEAWGRVRRPVINVSWEDARDYCYWLSEQTRQTYRLPSEAEWEYACRAGTDTPFYFGSRITTDQANYNGLQTYNGLAEGQYREKTEPVGSFPPNAFGLYDMHGNVWERCQDVWHENSEGAPADRSAWEIGGISLRVLRGGSWSSNPWDCRAASRFDLNPNNRNGNVGFRVRRAAPIE